MIFDLLYYASFLVFPFLVLFSWIVIKKGEYAYLFFIALALIFVWARFIEPQLLKVNREELKVTGFEPDRPLQVLFFSDPHIGAYNHKATLKRLVKKSNELKPDMVLIGGDFVFHLNPRRFKVFAELNKIEAPLYLVLGNHDDGRPRGTDVSKELLEAFEEYGIKVIENEEVIIDFSGKQIKLVGLSDYYSNDADYSLLHKDEADLFLVLTHNPDIAYNFPSESRVDLVLSGHTHGGQVRLPFIYQSLIPSDYGFNLGWYEVKGIKVFVSGGVGMVGLPLRFLMPPSVELLTIK